MCVYKYFDFLSCVCQQKSALKHGCPNNLVIHRLNMEKMGPFIYFDLKKVTYSYILTKKGNLFIYLASGEAEKGGYLGGTSLLCHI